VPRPRRRPELAPAGDLGRLLERHRDDVPDREQRPAHHRQVRSAPAELLPERRLLSHHRTSLPGAAVPNNLMKMNEMSAVQMKIRIEIADPTPRFSAVNRLS